MELGLDLCGLLTAGLNSLGQINVFHMPKAIFTLLVLATFLYAAVVSWHAPWAVITWGGFYNATTLSTQWGNQMAYVRQVGLNFTGTYNDFQNAYNLLNMLCRYVAIDVYNATYTWRGVYIYGDVYCSPNGTSWLWLKWLPLVFRFYQSDLKFVDFNATVYTPIGPFTGRVPEGWYADPSAHTVFQLPSPQGDALAAYARRVADLEAELAKARQELEAARQNATAFAAELSKVRAQLSEVLPLAQRATSAEAQASELAFALKRLGEELNSTKAELNATKTQLTTCRTALQSMQAEVSDKSSQLSKCQTSLMDAENRAQLLLFAVIGMAMLMVVYIVLSRLKR